ncbi:MAG: site-specific DNA-methyltransferase [Clostridia bacterium]|nr:site-specific DNA-methyltransferase [Clostridia bacterium]
MDKLKMMSMDKVQGNVEKIRALFPNAVTEVIRDGKPTLAVDFDVLKQELADTLIDDRELRYQFTWPDKQKSILLANTPVDKTLRPCKEESVDFDNTQNLYIEGDNLEVLKLLQETYLHRVDVIYIDPPYNTGKNYIYKNDFSMSAEDFYHMDSQFDTEGNRLVVNMTTNGRFHTDWLNMMYARLKVAHDLLSDEGVLICAIDENELATLSIMLKEIFGEMNYEFSYVSVVHNPRGQQGTNFSYVNEYAIFVYPNDGKKYLGDFKKKEIDARGLRDSGTESDRTDARNCFYPFIVKNGEIVSIGEVPDNAFHPLSANVIREDGTIEIWPITDDGKEKKWRYARQTVETIISKLTVKSGRNSLQIIFNKDMETMRSVWENARYDASEYGTKVVQNLLEIQDGFSFPKSLWLLYDTIKAVSENNKNAVILDFFSGSATTAHAVMQLNAEDNGNRKFIMVQLPEPCDEKSEAFKAGYKNICEIGKERIRRAGKKIKEENGINVQSLDIGFRVLKLDSSNMQPVYYHPEAYTQTLLDNLADNIKADRTPLDLLFQVMLDLGKPLSAKIEEKNIAGKHVFIVNDDDLIACFDSNVTEETVKAIAQLKPLYAVFRDSSLANDSTAANFDQIFATYSPNTVRKVL